MFKYIFFFSCPGETTVVYLGSIVKHLNPVNARKTRGPKANYGTAELCQFDSLVVPQGPPRN